MYIHKNIGNWYIKSTGTNNNKTAHTGTTNFKAMHKNYWGSSAKSCNNGKYYKTLGGVHVPNYQITE